MLALTACGGGGGETSNDQSASASNTAPIASNFFPVNNDIEVEVNEIISADFNIDLFALTLSNSSVTLTKGSAENAPFTVDYDEANKSVRLTPQSNLALATRYSVNLSTDITDLAGNALAETQWAFTTRDGNWQTNEVEIGEDTNYGTTSSVEIAFDDNKNARAIWSDELDVLWSNEKVFNEDWGTAIEIGINNGRAVSPQFVMNNDGSALVVWEEFGSNDSSIWARSYAKTIGWGALTLLETGDGSAHNVKIAMDDNGNAMAVWNQQSNGVYRVFANKFTAGNGWGTAQQIENIYTNTGANAPQIEMQSNGDALVVWGQTDLIGSGVYSSSIWSAKFSADTGWELPQFVETSEGFIPTLDIAMDAQGNVSIVWEQTITRSQIWSNRYDVVTGWGQSQAIETNILLSIPSAFDATVSVNKQGDAVAVWYQLGASGRFDIWSNHYSVVDGWGVEELIENNEVASARTPQISTDNEGNALAIYTIANRIWASRYIAGEGWKVEAIVDRDVTGGAAAVSPKVAMNSAGEAIAVWTYSNNSFISADRLSNIRTNYFK